jgi:TP901 family phage tail tape measure protein
LGTTKDGLKKIGEAIVNVDRRQRLLGQSIQTFARQGKAVDGLRQRYDEMVRASERLRMAQTRLAAANSAVESNIARRRAIGGQLAGASAGFLGVALPTVGLIRGAMDFETAMLGIARQVNGARDASGNLTSVYFEMGKAIQGLGRELPIATNEIADMVTSAARMGIAREDLIGFTREVAKMATAFEAPAAEIAESMGKVATIFNLPIKQIGTLGDAINYLDDNAMSKGSDIIKVLQGDLAGAASTMGLSAQNAAALASTFLTLGESAERADTAASGMLRQLQIAKMNPKKFQVGVQMLGMTSDQLQKGMISDTQGTILKVLDRIKALPQEKQMEAVTRLFGKDWGGAIAKLAGGVDKYRQQLQLANGEAQKGSMSREFSARMATTQAQWQLTKNRVGELTVAIGGSLLPAVNSLFQAVNPIVTRFAEWSKEHPQMIKGVVGTALAVTGLRVAVFGAGYAWTFLKAPFLQVAAVIARFRAASAVASLGRLGEVGLRAASAFRWVATAAAAIGAGPVVAAIGAVVVGAILVRKYWEPIKAFMIGMWEGFSASVQPALGGLMSSLSELKPAWDAFSAAVSAAWGWLGKLIDPVTASNEELGKATQAGIIFGKLVANSFIATVDTISAVVKAVVWLGESIGTVAGVIVVSFTSAWDKVKVIVGSAVDWMLAKIKPLTDAVGWVVSKASAVGNATSNLFGNAAAAYGASGETAGVYAAAAGRAPPALPAMSARSAGGVAVQQTHNYTITQQPGESQESLARRIAEEHNRKQQVQQRGRLTD